MLPVLRTDQAEMDLAETLDYLEQRSPQAAERLAEVPPPPKESRDPLELAR